MTHVPVFLITSPPCAALASLRSLPDHGGGIVYYYAIMICMTIKRHEVVTKFLMVSGRWRLGRARSCAGRSLVRNGRSTYSTPLR